jgi:DNA-binding transcriptional LysR family regulator
MAATEAGGRFAFRIARALEMLNARSQRTSRATLPVAIENRVSAAQLRTLVAVTDSGSYSAAARAIGTAQPTVHRAARALEARLGQALFQSTANRVTLTRIGERLARNARLAFTEIDLALLDIIETLSEGAGQIRVGALPLARATFLSKTIDLAIAYRPSLRVHVHDGPYSDLLLALRNGALDLLVGALRDPVPSRDVVQETLFEDRLGVFCGPGHPLLVKKPPTRTDLADYPWVVPPAGTPTRSYFDEAFEDFLRDKDIALVETSSMILVRELLQSNDRLTLISSAQVAAEVEKGVLFEIPVPLDDAPRPIGLTVRKDWHPTEAQRDFVDALRCNDWAAPFGGKQDVANA